MSSVSAYNPPLYGTAVWKDEDGTTRSSQVDILAIASAPDNPDAIALYRNDERVFFICATADKDRRTVWAYAEDVTIDPRLYRNAGR